MIAQTLDFFDKRKLNEIVQIGATVPILVLYSMNKLQWLNRQKLV